MTMVPLANVELWTLGELLWVDAEKRRSRNVYEQFQRQVAGIENMPEILAELQRKGVVEISTEAAWKITQFGIATISQQRFNYIGAVHGLLWDFPTDRSEEIPNIEDDEVFAPSASGYVTLQHNSRQLRELKVTVDDAIHALRGINHELDERTALALVELEAGRRLLEADRADVTLLRRLLFDSLKFLKQRTFNVAVDALLLAALTAAAHFLGLL